MSKPDFDDHFTCMADAQFSDDLASDNYKSSVSRAKKRVMPWIITAELKVGPGKNFQVCPYPRRHMTKF